MKNKDDPEKASTEMLNWFQIIMLMGKPLWDAKQRKWRILNGYQSILGNNNTMYFEVTFTDTPHWENFIEKELYLNVPKENKTNEKDKENSNKSPKNNKNKEENKK